MTQWVDAWAQCDRWSDFEHIWRGVKVGLYMDHLLR